MMDRHHHTPLADLNAAVEAITACPWHPDPERDYRILRALRVPVAPIEIRRLEPLLGEHFCFFGARDPKWKTWICLGNDLVPRHGPPWYADVQEAELVLNIEAWVWYRARDALYRLIKVSVGGWGWLSSPLNSLGAMPFEASDDTSSRQAVRCRPDPPDSLSGHSTSPRTTLTFPTLYPSRPFTLLCSSFPERRRS